GGVSAAVALHDNSIQAEKDAAVQLARIHLLFQGAKCALRQNRACAREPRSLHGGTQILTDLLSGSLRRLKGDFAGVTVGNNDVGGAMADIVALDEAAKIDGELRFSQDRGGLLDVVEALDLLDTDIQQVDRGASKSEQGTRQCGAHQCEFN